MEREQKATRLLEHAIEVLYDENLDRFEGTLNEFEMIVKKVIVRHRADIDKNRSKRANGEG